MSTQESMNEVQVSFTQTKLHRLFLKYATVSNKLNQSYMRLKKFIQLLVDSEIMVSFTQDRSFSLRKAELIFCSSNKNQVNMRFETFLETIPKILQEKFPTEFRKSPGSTLSMFLSEHIWPLLQSLEEETDLAKDLLEDLDSDCASIFKDSYNSLRHLYEHCFPWERRRNLEAEFILEKSHRGLNDFMRDFDISPSLLSKNQVVELWNRLVLYDEEPSDADSLLPSPQADLGMCLSLRKFLVIIFVAAVKGYEGDESLGDSACGEKVLVLFERMELAKGFQELSVKSRNITLLPSQEVIHQVLYPESDDVEEFSRISEETEEAAESVHEEDHYGITIGSEALSKLDQAIDQIQHLFQAYCSFGEPLNTTKMSSSKLTKMMRECGLLPNYRFDTSSMSSFNIESALEPVHVDLIYTRNAKKGRLDFKQFLKVLHQISARAFPSASPDEAFITLIENYISKLNNDWNEERGISSTSIRNKMDILKNSDVIEALSLVHKSVIYFYRFYANTQGFMVYDSFLRFCKDFSIFPELIAQSKLKRFFCTLAAIHAQTEQPDISMSRSYINERRKSSSSQEMIDEHLFVEALALISVEVQYKEPEPTPVERVCYLIERMSQSEGPIKVLKGFGHNRSAAGESQDMRVHLKNRYPEVFEGCEGSTKVGFIDILADMPEDSV